jgi:anaerobic selenocysteine-containing dehydrogenase
MKAMRNDRGDRQLHDLVGEVCRYLLPDLMTVEQEDIIPNDYAGNMGYLIFLQPVTAPKFERKPIYWIMSEVAKRLGPISTRSLPKGALRSSGCSICTPKCWKRPKLPSYDELKKMGIYKRKDPNGHFVAYKNSAMILRPTRSKPHRVRLKFTPARWRRSPDLGAGKRRNHQPAAGLRLHL